MGELSRRSVLTAATTAALGSAVAGCSDTLQQPRSVAGASGTAAAGKRKVRIIGDASTADTGAQPNQPHAVPLEPGETPPQFVIFSWDGAGETDAALFSRFLKVAEDHDAKMTFFLSGIFLLPEAKRKLYLPPHHAPGASAIGYLTDAHIRATLEQLTKAWNAGHEIGTHFNGHFCGAGGVREWSPEDWDSEIEQAIKFVMTWKTNTGFTDLPPLPFDYRKELIGGRAPCLEGQRNLLPTAAKRGWKYDASSPGGMQMWPSKREGVWDYPLQAIPFPGHTFEVLSMDYNIMANQNGGNPKGDPTKFDAWRTQAAESYKAGFDRTYHTNRAPYFVGNHLETWNGGIYMDAVEQFIQQIAGTPDTRLVSFRQFTEWQEAQDPAVLRKLRTLDPGHGPTEGWKQFLGTPGPTR
ncbi:hypothetical protein [Streptomyces sp. NBC_00859]|uniref:hypothetical protein n=1 Tax=Streptomyces sp. NBC_00859 TaxID=2903682 RepID=UPI003869289F|nr:hypothetical protein OG584_32440 [Streptomyces sp. NBC_00859]